MIPICGIDPIGLARFAQQQDFNMAHPLPEAYQGLPLKGKKISWPTADGERGVGYQVEGGEDSKKVVFVIHEWWGLNDHIKGEAERLKEALGGVKVIALDLYDGKVATTREDAGKYMQSVSEERANNIIRGAIDFLGEEVEIATIGWCFGGGWSLRASLLAESQAAACVIYYGMPVQGADNLANLRTNVLGIFATQDGWVTPEVVETFEEDMKEAGKDLSVHSFDAAHGFANPSNPKHDEEASNKAWEETIAYMKNAFSL